MLEAGQNWEFWKRDCRKNEVEIVQPHILFYSSIIIIKQKFNISPITKIIFEKLGLKLAGKDLSSVDNPMN